MMSNLPVGWKKTEVRENIKFSGGAQPPRSVFSFEPQEGYIRLIQIRDYKTDKFATYIPKGLAKKLCDEDDIMIGRYGPPIFQILRGINGAYNVALIKAIPQKHLHKEYMYYFLKKESLLKFIESFSQRTSGQTGIEMDMLNTYPMPLPPLPEQIKIASILSTWDNAINTVQKLLANSQQQKKVLMQQLLTGKKRFAGFGSGWKRVLLGEIADLTAGGTPSTNMPEYWQGDILWMSSGEVNQKYIYSVEGRVSELGLKNSSTKIIPINSVLIALAGQGKTRGTVAINRIELCTNQSIAAVILNQDIAYPDFVFFNLDSRYFELRAMSGGDGGRGGLNLSILKSILIKLPSLPEQQKIATILTTADQEIDNLRAQLNHLKQEKKALMQQLLTGKRRVKVEEAA